MVFHGRPVKTLLALVLLLFMVPPAMAEEAEVHRGGAIFGAGLGGAGLLGSGLGDGGYSGYVQIGYWFTRDVSASFFWHGYVGPRPGDAAFSMLTWAGRLNYYAAELAPDYDLYLVAAPGATQLATSPGGGGNGNFQGSLTYGAGLTLGRFSYFTSSVEVLGLTVYTGPDKFSAVGGYLTLWMRTDAGVVGTKDTY